VTKNYTALPGSAFSDDDAQIIGRFLDRKFPDGQFTAKDVLEAARPRSSEIHRFVFSTSPQDAAERYYLLRARKLISCLVVHVDDVPTKKYVSRVFVESSAKKMFMDVDRARRSEDIWSQVMDQAMRDAIRFRDRYSRLKKIGPIIKAINRVEAKLKEKSR